jgi:hypothetical protein
MRTLWWSSEDEHLKWCVRRGESNTETDLYLQLEELQIRMEGCDGSCRRDAGRRICLKIEMALV